jgi:hypothetical protein
MYFIKIIKNGIYGPFLIKKSKAVSTFFHKSTLCIDALELTGSYLFPFLVFSHLSPTTTDYTEDLEDDTNLGAMLHGTKILFRHGS